MIVPKQDMAQDTAAAALRRPLRRLGAGASLVLLALLGACATAPQRLMLLSNDVVVPPAPAAVQRPMLVVRTVAMPEYLDRRSIIYRSSDSELKRFPEQVWAERLGESVTRWMALQLAADLPGYEVEAFGAASEKSPALALNMELQSFEPDAASGVLHLRGSWHLAGASVTDGRLSADVPMGTLDAAATVAAMRTALMQASDGIAAQIRQMPLPAGK